MRSRVAGHAKQQLSRKLARCASLALIEGPHRGLSQIVLILARHSAI
jgi:hypothetical protein